MAARLARDRQWFGVSLARHPRELASERSEGTLLCKLTSAVPFFTRREREREREAWRNSSTLHKIVRLGPLLTEEHHHEEAHEKTDAAPLLGGELREANEFEQMIR